MAAGEESHGGERGNGGGRADVGFPGAFFVLMVGEVFEGAVDAGLGLGGEWFFREAWGK